MEKKEKKRKKIMRENQASVCCFVHTLNMRPMTWLALQGSNCMFRLIIHVLDVPCCSEMGGSKSCRGSAALREHLVRFRHLLPSEWDNLSSASTPWIRLDNDLQRQLIDTLSSPARGLNMRWNLPGSCFHHDIEGSARLTLSSISQFQEIPCEVVSSSALEFGVTFIPQYIYTTETVISLQLCRVL